MWDHGSCCFSLLSWTTTAAENLGRNVHRPSHILQFHSCYVYKSSLLQPCCRLPSSLLANYGFLWVWITFGMMLVPNSTKYTPKVESFSDTLMQKRCMSRLWVTLSEAKRGTCGELWWVKWNCVDRRFVWFLPHPNRFFSFQFYVICLAVRHTTRISCGFGSCNKSHFTH